MTISVDYIELNESGKLSIGEDDRPVGERLFQVDWDDSVQMLQELKGSATALIPTRPDVFPWLTSLYCVEATREGTGKTLGEDGGQIAYSTAEIRAVYKPVEFDESGLRVLIDETLEPTSEFLTLPADGLFWDASQAEPIAPEEAPGRLIKMLDWVYTVYEVEKLPTQFLSKLGYVNSGTVKSTQLKREFAAETLLIGTEPLRRQVTTEGVGLWTVTWRFTYNPLGWNKYLRAGTATPATMYDDNGDAFVQYPTTDFGEIVR